VTNHDTRRPDACSTDAGRADAIRPAPADGAPPEPVARAVGVRRVFGAGEAAVTALRGVDIALRGGEVVALTGPSGSGKSTLLHLLGAMDVPDGGRVEVCGQDLAALDDEAASAFRNRRIGLVFQSFHLLPSLTVRENVALPARLAGRPAGETDAAVRALAERVGLLATLDRRPDELSGGQRQRVAIARALVNGPALVLADEPTGNLDHEAGGEVMRLLVELGRERGAAVLVATHDPLVTAAADREVRLMDGAVVDGPMRGVPAPEA
jgi:putative ABC transport system ATP-binding protein